MPRLLSPCHSEVEDLGATRAAAEACGAAGILLLRRINVAITVATIVAAVKAEMDHRVTPMTKASVRRAPTRHRTGTTVADSEADVVRDGAGRLRPSKPKDKATSMLLLPKRKEATFI
jgi:hypothetical protein